MREILFKAKRKDNDEWVEGYYVPHIVEGKIVHHFILTGEADLVETEDDELILKFYWEEIDPDTLCQYTGLTDKNGKKIWENDILKGYQYPFLSSEGKENYYAEVVWFTNCNAFGTYTFKNPRANVCGISEGNTELMENWNPEDWEVIGNIFDNADLLEVN